MKDSDWKIINALYETPSITKVAAMMYKSQSAITKRIQIMEEELDCRIVERTPLGVSFTREGEFLYNESLKYLQFENEVAEGLRYIKEQTKKNIIIGSAYTYTKYTLYDALDDFIKAHPDVSIRIVNKQSNLLYNMLLEGKLDVAFIRSDYIENVYHELIDHTTGYIVSREPVNVSDLPKMERIAYQTNSKTIQKISDWWSDRFGTEIPDAAEDVGYIEFAFRNVATSHNYQDYSKHHTVDQTNNETKFNTDSQRLSDTKFYTDNYRSNINNNFIGGKYLLCFLPDNFVNEYNLCLQPMLRSDGTPVSRNSWFIYRKEKNRRRVVDDLIKYVDKNVKIR